MALARIVVDTNVLVAAALSGEGSARKVVRICLRGEVLPLISNALFLEYEDVFGRDKIFKKAPLGREDRAALLDAFLGTCRWINIASLWRPNLRDEADNHLVELAVAGNAERIVTANKRDLMSGELVFEAIRVLTPAEFISEGA